MDTKIPGLNIIAPFMGEFSLARIARELVYALGEAKIPTALNNVDIPWQKTTDRSLNDFTTLNSFTKESPYPITLAFLNPEMVEVCKRQYGPTLWKDRYLIAYWVWATDNPPPFWGNVSRQFNEVWTGSEFSAKALARISKVPVYTVRPFLPTNIDVPDKFKDRASVNFREDRFVFFYVCDFNGTVSRKNPQVLISAFNEAFSPTVSNEDLTRGKRPLPSLVLKVRNSHLNKRAKEELLRQINSQHENEDRVVLIDEDWTREQLLAAIAHADVYVSPHRAEALGLTIAEAFLRAKPVIMTDYGSPGELVGKENYFSVPYTLQRQNERDGPYQVGTLWADVSIPDLADTIKNAYTYPARGEKLGQKAKQEIELKYNRLKTKERWLALLTERANLIPSTEPPVQIIPTETIPPSELTKTPEIQVETPPTTNDDNIHALKNQVIVVVPSVAGTKYYEDTAHPMMPACFFRQTFKNWTMLMIHDGSHPRFQEEIEAFNDSRIKLYEIDRKVKDGGNSLRKFGLTVAREEDIPGRYVLVTNPENYYVPGFLDVMVGNLLRQERSRPYPQTVAAYCNAIHAHLGWNLMDSKLVYGHIDGGCLLVRKEAALKVGWNSTGQGDDWDFVQALISEFGLDSFIKVPIPLFVRN